MQIVPAEGRPASSFPAGARFLVSSILHSFASALRSPDSGIGSGLGRTPARFAGATFLLYALVWALCLATFAADATLPGGYASDTNRLFVPFRACLLRTLGKGNFPDLVQGIFYGHPILSVGQVSPLYPTTLAGLIFPASHHAFFLFDLWFHLVVASAGCALFLRGRGHSVAAALVLGWVYANSSAVLFRTWGHWTLLHQAAWLPAVLYAWERLALPRRLYRSELTLAAFLGLMVLAHNPQWVYLLVLLLLPLELARMVYLRHIVPVPRRLGGHAFGAVAAALLGAAVLLPAVAGFADSFRGMLTGTDLARRWDLSPRNLISLFFPYSLFQNGPGEFRGRWSAVESVLLVGRGTMLFALAGLAAALARPRSLFRQHALPLWLIAGGLFLGTAPSMPWFEALVRGLPLYGSFRAWGRVSIFIALGLVMLAATGLDVLLRPGLRNRRLPGRIMMLAGGGLAAVAAALLWALEETPRDVLSMFRDRSGVTKPTVQALEILAASFRRDLLWYAGWAAVAAGGAFSRRGGRARMMLLAIAPALLAAELLLFQRFVFRERAPVLEPSRLPELSAWLRQKRAASSPAPYTTVFLPPELVNFALHFDGIRTVGGADSNMRAAWAVWLSDVQGYAPDSYQLDTHIGVWNRPLIEGTGLRSRVEVGGRAAGVPAEELLDGAYLITEFPEGAPYAEFRADGNTTASGDASVYGSVRVTLWDEDLIRLRSDAASPAAVRIREFPDRRWRATVNGQDRKPEHDGTHLLLPVPAGKSEIELRYVDEAARAGLALSSLAWLLAGFTAAARWRRRKAPAEIRPKSGREPGETSCGYG